MSNEQIINEQGNTGKNVVDKLSFKDEVRAYEKGKATVLWFNPAKTYEVDKNTGAHVLPEHVYMGGNNSPTWIDPVINMKMLLENRQRIKSAQSTDIYKVLVDPYVGDWKNIAHEYAETKAINNGHTRSASIGTEADFSAIDVVNVLAEMVATELRTFVLEQALTVIGTPQLDLKVDTYTRFQAEQGVPEGVAPIPQRAAVSRTSYDLTKDVATIGITDEAQLRTVHDLYKQQVDTAVTDFKRVKSNKIATKLATATSASGADWAAFTTDHNTTDPRANIGTAADIIFSNNGAPNVLATHDKPWRNFSSSTFIKGVLQAIPLPDMSMAKIINQVPSMPGFTWYVDNEMTSTILSIFDRKAVALLQGPVRTAQYRLELEGIDGYLYRDWNLPVFLVSNRVRQVTGVA
jgi:hypothetical protein